MNMFTKHPSEVGLNYFQHFLFAFSVVYKLIIAVFCCTIHAFFPFLFNNSPYAFNHLYSLKNYL